jgi:hypothetical protein
MPRTLTKNPLIRDAFGFEKNVVTTNLLGEINDTDEFGECKTTDKFASTLWK